MKAAAEIVHVEYAGTDNASQVLGNRFQHSSTKFDVWYLKAKTCERCDAKESISWFHHGISIISPALSDFDLEKMQAKGEVWLRSTRWAPSSYKWSYKPYK